MKINEPGVYSKIPPTDGVSYRRKKYTKKKYVSLLQISFPNLILNTQNTSFKR